MKYHKHKLHKDKYNNIMCECGKIFVRNADRPWTEDYLGIFS